jgi:hypothetical protein
LKVNKENTLYLLSLRQATGAEEENVNFAPILSPVQKNIECVILAGSTSRDVFLYRTMSVQPRSSKNTTGADLALEYIRRAHYHWTGTKDAAPSGLSRLGNPPGECWQNGTVEKSGGAHARHIPRRAAHRKENRCARNKIHQRLSVLPNGQFAPKVARAR